MSITITSATNDELTALFQGLNAVTRISGQGEWWSTVGVAAGNLLSQVNSQIATQMPSNPPQPLDF